MPCNFSHSSLCHQLLIASRSSIATIVRIRYVYQLALTDDFLYDNVDIAIWSTVETGLCITTGAMICLRPLFHTYLSDSWLMGAPKTRTSARTSASKPPYFRGPDNGGVEELGIYRTLGKRIHVETVTTISESRNGWQDSDVEAQTNSSIRESGSKTALIGGTTLPV